jgi:hypothetical protein
MDIYTPAFSSCLEVVISWLKCDMELIVYLPECTRHLLR